MEEAVANGAEIVEIRLDFIESLNAEDDIPRLVEACCVPCIVTFRPIWEGGKYDGSEAERLAALRWAAEAGVSAAPALHAAPPATARTPAEEDLLSCAAPPATARTAAQEDLPRTAGAEYVDVEYKVAPIFFAAPGRIPDTTAVIVSSHDYEKTPSDEELQQLVAGMWEVGADVVKVATTASDVSDAMRVLRLLESRKGPTVALAMGEKGVATRILAAKYGGFLTFGALSSERQSAPGQPTLRELRDVYRLKAMGMGTKVYGIVGNPVAQSKSPAIHNPSFQALGVDAVYVPLLVDDVPSFLRAFSSPDFAGFSVTIPHKEAALASAAEVDPVAKKIGACNTLVRRPDGELVGFNTDWQAALDAIEEAARRKWGPSERPLEGRTVVVLGAGGAARGVVFGALDRGARVVVVNRTLERAEAIAREAEPAGAVEVASAESLAAGEVAGDVLANTTAVGMVPRVDESPVPAEVAGSFGVVFDAVYNPMETRLLREAAAGGAEVANGVEMFVGQAAAQFRYFTGRDAPVDLMTRVVVESLSG